MRQGGQLHQLHYYLRGLQVTLRYIYVSFYNPYKVLVIFPYMSKKDSKHSPHNVFISNLVSLLI